MSDLVTILLILSLYLCISIAIGIYGRSSEESAEDYFVASRKINPWVLFCTLAATNFSAFFFLGFAGASYRAGWGFYGIMAMGTSLVGLSILTINPPSSEFWSNGEILTLFTSLLIFSINMYRPLFLSLINKL